MSSDTGYSCSAANHRSLVAAMRTTDAGPRRYALMVVAGDPRSTSLGDSLRPTKLDARRAGTRWGREERFPSAA
jgi:hypothetical protein